MELLTLGTVKVLDIQKCFGYFQFCLCYPNVGPWDSDVGNFMYRQAFKNHLNFCFSCLVPWREDYFLWQ